jgi:hypothetical protein
MSNPINISGTKLENQLKEFLVEYNYPFIDGGSKDIDFIIEIVNQKIYVDCTNQNTEGSVVDKIPQKIFKYYQKHKMDKFYIVRGEYKNFPKPVCDHISFLEDYFKFKVIILTYDEFIKILMSFNNFSF